MPRIIRSKTKTRRHAFTLVELVVNIAIALVLFGIISRFYYSNRLHRGEGNCLANLHQIDVALEMYKQDNGDYPNFRPPDQMTPMYIKTPSVFTCPLEYRDLKRADTSAPGFKAKYLTSYYWPCMPSQERNIVYERRGGSTPLVYCDVHSIVTADQYKYIVLRANGSVNTVPVSSVGNAQSSYDY